MWNYQTLKEKFWSLANRAEADANNARLKKGKAPEVFQNLHDVDLARRDVYSYLATSDYATQQDFLDALNQLLNAQSSNTKAFDEQKYLEARKSVITELINEYQ